MKLFGALLSLAACLYAALVYQRASMQRIRLLEALVRALRRIEAELCAKAAPLPAIMQALSREGGCAGGFFAALSRGLQELGTRSFAELWSEAAAALPALDGADRAILAELGSALGRYPLPLQQRAVEDCAARLAERLETARGRYREQSRLVWALALSAGALLGIVLI